MNDTAPFFVWRRDDGYVGVTRYAPKGDGFDILLGTDDWPKAMARRDVERQDPRHVALVADMGGELTADLCSRKCACGFVPHP